MTSSWEKSLDSRELATPHLPVRVSDVSPLRRFWRGLQFGLQIPVLGVGVMLGRLLRPFQTPERHEQGLVIVLPGIEGQSLLNHNIVRGLADSGIPQAIRIFDWTTRVILLFLIHLRSRRLHQRAIRNLTRQILDYRRQYPGRPVTLIGHSGGAAIAVLTVEQLPEECQVDHVILLAGSLSAGFNLAPSMRRIKGGLWNFYSPLDFVFLAMGTLVCGTLDGQWTISGGNCGFHLPEAASEEDQALYAERLRQFPHRREMLASWNFGEHLWCTNRVFIAEWVAPLINPPQSGT